MSEVTEKKPAARKPATPRKRSAALKSTENKPAEKPVVHKRELRPDDYVTVKNGYDGRLIYKSSKTGEKFEFERFGDEHDMELQELKKAKNDAKAFFRNNWFLIEDPDVIEYLGIGEYYKNALKYDEFSELANMTADEISERMKKVSEGQKVTIAHHARRMIANGEIDSLKAISALEEGLGVQLIEH